MRTSSSLRRVAAAAVGAAGLLLVTALPAGAHVTVSSPDAEPGGFGKLVFRVPNESDTASTTKLVVRLPADTPFGSVSTKPMPGWTVEAEPTKLDQPVDVHGATVTEAVQSITWTADDGGLPPDQFAEFEVSVGPFPEDVESLTLPAIQTYDDGEVARWVEQVEQGAPEPERPAPTLELAATGDAGGHGGDAGNAEADDAVTPASSTAAASTATDDGSDMLARTLGGIAVVLAAAALVWSMLAGRRARD
ncbi:MAG TPA: YcnI family protein [Nocardioidaceae bacterium]|nr:YcnI family protein [Nocardioidaceae bacterium]